MSLQSISRSLKIEHRSLVLAAFSRSVWDVLRRPSSAHRLAEGDLLRVEEELRDVAARRMILSGAAGDSCSVRFPSSGGFPVFQVEAAGAIVCRLEASLDSSRHLDLITRDIPEALSGTLAGQAWPAGFGAGKAYRLVSSARVFTAPVA